MEIPNGTAAVKRLSAYMPLWLHMGRQADLYSKSEDLPFAVALKYERIHCCRTSSRCILKRRYSAFYAVPARALFFLKADIAFLCFCSCLWCNTKHICHAHNGRLSSQAPLCGLGSTLSAVFGGRYYKDK